MLKIGFFAVVTLAGVSVAFPSFKNEIPNGDNVPNPCDSDSLWTGVGHENSEGDGKLNPFGVDFKDSYKKWTTGLCQKDSDGDGRTNGEELGDPDCKWVGILSNRFKTSSQDYLSHPGVCEPLTAAKCKEVNKFLYNIPVCKAVLENAAPPTQNERPLLITIAFFLVLAMATI